MEAKSGKRTAYQFIVLLGLVSLFGDITYEGARSITGPYLAVLGASAVVVGLVSGLGEFLGYALRLAAGYFADRTRAYWPLTLLGYGLLVSVPLLALTGHWPLAALLIILERIGKAVRSPARDTILSHATKQVGRGWGFGLHEALDQIGAVAGPLLFTTVFFFHGNYSEGFSLLWIPALLCFGILLFARRKVPVPENLESTAMERAQDRTPQSLPRSFWVYTLFIFFSVTGFVNFQIIAFHLKTQQVVSDAVIPLLYAVAMGVDAVVALLIGRLYDRVGLKALIFIPFLTAVLPFLSLSRHLSWVVAGMALWGAVMGIHETVMRAAIADLAPLARRGFAYGIFNTAYGLAWLLGSSAIGILYSYSRGALGLMVLLLQGACLAVFFKLRTLASERA